MVSVLVNGRPTMEFKSHKELRQGDPLGPFLFLIATESLAWVAGAAENLGVLEGLRINK